MRYVTPVVPCSLKHPKSSGGGSSSKPIDLTKNIRKRYGTESTMVWAEIYCEEKVKQDAIEILSSDDEQGDKSHGKRKRSGPAPKDGNIIYQPHSNIIVLANGFLIIQFLLSNKVRPPNPCVGCVILRSLFHGVVGYARIASKTEWTTRMRCWASLRALHHTF